MITPYHRIKNQLRDAGSFLHHRFGNGVLGSNGTADTDLSRLEFVLQSEFPKENTDGGEIVFTPDSKTAHRNPVLTKNDIIDYGDVDYIADPFLHVERAEEQHLFMEVFNQERTPTAAIGHAVSRDGHVWNYDRIVLRLRHHLSFPYVFRRGAERYMVPDKWSRDPESPAPTTLYRAREFPTDWTEAATIVAPEKPLHDFVVFRWNDRWWTLGGNGHELHAYFSETLERDDWTPHAENPVVEGRPTAARPGGRPIVRDDSILLFLQDCDYRYGEMLRAYEITSLSPDSYADRELQHSPLLTPSSNLFGWNSGGMHHIDIYYSGNQWYCAVDGNIGFGWRVFDDCWSIGILTPMR